MTDHLPECPITVHKGECCYDDPLFGFPCWCDTLRACEQRVRDEERGWEGAVVIARAGYEDGYAAALDAAREALDALPTEQTVKEGVSEFWVEINHAIAAIDALKEKT